MDFSEKRQKSAAAFKRNIENKVRICYTFAAELVW